VKEIKTSNKIWLLFIKSVIEKNEYKVIIFQYFSQNKKDFITHINWKELEEPIKIDTGCFDRYFMSRDLKMHNWKKQEGMEDLYKIFEDLKYFTEDEIAFLTRIIYQNKHNFISTKKKETIENIKKEFYSFRIRQKEKKQKNEEGISEIKKKKEKLKKGELNLYTPIFTKRINLLNNILEQYV